MSDEATVQDLQRRLQERRKDLAAARPEAPAPPPAAPEVHVVAQSLCAECGAANPLRLSGNRQLCHACIQEEFRAAAPGPAVAASTRPTDPLERARAAGGNPWKFGRSTFATFRPFPGRETAAVAAHAFADLVLARTDPFEETRGLLLWGDTGLAKTELLHCTLRHLLDRGLEPRKGVLFVDWRSFVHEVQGTYGRDSAWAVISRCIRTDVLLLDDLFAGKIRPDVIDIAFTILNQREGRPTMITTNLDPDSIDDELIAATSAAVEHDAARIRSRLGAYRVVQVKGDEDGRLLRAEGS